jgi:hypothetical protein
MENSRSQLSSPGASKPDESGDNADIVSDPRSQSAEAEDLVRNAMDYVRELIRVNEGHWNFYRNVNPSILEQWLKDDHPNLHRCVIRVGAYDAFKEQLLEYCGRLSAATALAEMYFERYSWSVPFSLVTPFRFKEYGRETMYEPSSVATEGFFPGVASNIENGRLPCLEELPAMVALLVDRLLRIRHATRHHNAYIALHSILTDCFAKWCDLEKVRESSVGTAFVMSRRAFSEELFDLTPERYALVMRMPADTSVDSLVRGARVARYVDSRGGQAKDCLAFSDGKVAIPVLRNEELLLKFRNFIPIVLLVGEEMLLVEYEWNPTAFGSDFIAAIHDGETEVNGNDAVEGGETVTEKAGSAVVISDVYAMPLIPGAPEYLASDYVQPVWMDSIPF